MKELLEEIEAYRKERGWTQQNPVSLAKSVVIESAELLEVFQWSSPTLKELRRDKETLAKLTPEMADVLIYLYCLCNDLEINPDDIVRKKLAQVRKKYPPKLVKGNSANYYKLKKAHRAKGSK